MDAVEVGLAGKDYERSCAAMIPQVRGENVEFLVARADGETVGAAAIRWINWNEPAGFPLTVEVSPRWRRRGIGRRLAEFAVQLVRGESAGLWSIASIPIDNPAASFAESCGFSVMREIFHFRVDTNVFDQMVAPIAARLSRRDRTARFRTGSLRDAPLEEVAAMVSRSFDRGPERLLALLRRSVAATDGDDVIDADLSVVTYDGDEVAGAIFGRWNDGRCVIEGNVVAPSCRGSAVNALQLAASARNILKAGSAEFSFKCDDDVLDSLNLARRAGASLVATDARYYRLAS